MARLVRPPCPPDRLGAVNETLVGGVRAWAPAGIEVPDAAGHEGPSGHHVTHRVGLAQGSTPPRVSPV